MTALIAIVFQRAKSLVHLPLTANNRVDLLTGYTDSQCEVMGTGVFLPLPCEYLNNLYAS